jgi:hypothetical protein
LCGQYGHFAYDCQGFQTNYIDYQSYSPNSGNYSAYPLNYTDSSTYHPNYVEGKTYVGAVESNVATTISEYYDNNWYMDSWASSHVIGQYSNLELVDEPLHTQNVTTGDGQTHRISAIGTTTINSGSWEIKLNKVLYVLALKRNLLSIGSLTDDGLIMVFTNTQCLEQSNLGNR